MHNSSTARRKGPDTDPWSIHKLVRDETRRMDLGSVGWSDASLNNAAGLTGHVVQLVLDAMPVTG